MEDTKIKEAIASVMKDKNQREALAELLVEYIQPNHITTDFISLLLNTRNLKPGDSLIKKIRKGITVHTLVPGSVSLKSEVTVSDRMNYVLDGAIVSLMANYWELESGEIGTIESLRAEAMAKLRDMFMNKVFNALASVWNGSNTPDNYVSAGGAISSTVLKNAIDRINQTTSGVKAVIGVRSALTPITTFGGFWSNGATTTEVPSAIKEIMDTGWLGKYYGAPIIALNQVWDNPEDHNTMLPTDKVLVVGENVGEFITYGDVKTKEYDEMRPTPPYWNLDIYQQFGLMVDNAQGIYVIGGIS
jgi:hypothetical protein